MTQAEPQESQEPDPLVGAVVAGKFRIVKQLGEGGMGCVYLAEQQLGSTVRKVALKTLHKHLSHDPQIKKRFDLEAGTVAALEHPNTIQVYDFGTMEDGTLYLVMEFVQGRSVADILEKDGAMSPVRVENILRQVCGSLEEAHSHGIVHRDMKPDNVVLCERAGQKDWVEVLDFGIAKRSKDVDPNEAKLTQQGMVLGTPPYMSPEQFTGQPVDERSDIYALGVMTYEMLVGKYPFEANTAWEWASKHMTELPRPIETQPLGPNVPERMRNAITRALAKNKDERFATVMEFYQALASSAAPQTAAMSAASAASADGNLAGVGSAPARPKTEMAAPAPMMGGPPAGAMTPPYGASPPVSGGGAPIAIPSGPAHGAHAQGGEKKGGMGLVIGLGVLAVLLIGGGAAAYALRGKSKPVTSDPFANASTVVAVVESASAPVPTEDPTVAPLGATSGAAATSKPVAVATGSGTKPPASVAAIPTPKIKPVDVPKPKIDPPECAVAREAKKNGSPNAQRLAEKCTRLGGQL